MTPIPAAITALFVGIVFVVAVALVLGMWRASRRLGDGPVGTARWTGLTAVLTVLWLALTALVASAGLLRDFAPVPPPLLRLVIPTTLATAIVAFSPIGTRLATGLGLTVLIGFQAFRVPLELVLFLLHREDIVPIQMTFEGINFDVLTGVFALAVAGLAARGRLPNWGAIVWNLLGLGLLINVVVIGILSAPVPFRAFHDGPANTFVAEAPFIWLPVFLVQAALFGHLLVFRHLQLRREASAPRDRERLGAMGLPLSTR